MKRRDLVSTAAAVFALALTAAACGGGSSDDNSTAAVVQESPTEAPVAVVEEEPTEVPVAVVEEEPTEVPTVAVEEEPTEVPAVEEEPTEEPAGSDEPIELTIFSDNVETYNISRLEAKAGVEITVTFQNKDEGSGEPHNFRVEYMDEDISTPLSPGPDTNSVTFTIDTPGDYPYLCDIHGETMAGTLVLTP